MGLERHTETDLVRAVESWRCLTKATDHITKKLSKTLEILDRAEEDKGNRLKMLLLLCDSAGFVRDLAALEQKLNDYEKGSRATEQGGQGQNSTRVQMAIKWKIQELRKNEAYEAAKGLPTGVYDYERLLEEAMHATSEEKHPQPGQEEDRETLRKKYRELGRVRERGRPQERRSNQWMQETALAVQILGLRAEDPKTEATLARIESCQKTHPERLRKLLAELRPKWFDSPTLAEAIDSLNWQEYEVRDQTDRLMEGGKILSQNDLWFQKDGYWFQKAKAREFDGNHQVALEPGDDNIKTTLDYQGKSLKVSRIMDRIWERMGAPAAGETLEWVLRMKREELDRHKAETGERERSAATGLHARSGE